MLKQYGAVITVSLILILIGVTASCFADDDITKQMYLQCQYKAGITMRTQIIRQQTGDDWPAFQKQTNSMYQHDEGLVELQKLAKLVYDAVPLEVAPQEVFDATFAACMAGWEAKMQKQEEQPEIEL